jgi:hypothetical protein
MKDMMKDIMKDIMKDMKSTLSMLWIFVMFNMVFADIIGFLNTGFLEEMIAMKPHEGLVLALAVMVEIPILMIILARFLPHKLNRMANLTGGMFTILWVVGGGNMSLSYIFFATIEVAVLLVILWIAWTWKRE